MRLEPLELWIERQPGPLRPQVLAALRQHGEPLRWAITAVAAKPPAGPPAAGAQAPGSAGLWDALAGATGFREPGADAGPLAAGRSGADALGQAGAAASRPVNGEPPLAPGAGSGWLRLEAVLLQ